MCFLINDRKWILKKVRSRRLGVWERFCGGRGIWGYSIKDGKNLKGRDNGKVFLVKRIFWV